MELCVSCDFASVPPHPLIYASLEPRYSPSYARRLDLHWPKTKYTIGRSPMNDFVLDDEWSGQIDWTHCTLVLNENSDLSIVENSTTNGIWVNNRLLSSGESCSLQDGDSVRFGMCILLHCKTHELTDPANVRGRCHSYIFRSFIDRIPPGLPPAHKNLRGQFEELRRMKAELLEERARLDKKLEDLEQESRRITRLMPDVPPTKPANALIRAQGRYKLLTESVRLDYPDFFPEELRDFCPQPWLPPHVEEDSDGHDIALRRMYLAFGAPPNKRPPPLSKDYTMKHFTRALHHEDAPDWNHPEVVWGDLQALNLSNPLLVPPSIIFWSIEHHLPVYMHPKFLKASRKGPYAHPYASSEYVFADESAVLNRKMLGLPPMEDPYPLRPLEALKFRSVRRTLPDEEEVAERVALLRSKRASSRVSSAEPSSPHHEAQPVAPVLISSKRPRISDVDARTDMCNALEERTSCPSPASPSEPVISGETASECIFPRHSPALEPTDVSSSHSSIKLGADEGTIFRHSATAPPPKRQKMSHSPTPSLTAASGPPIPTEEVTPVPRTSPEPFRALPGGSTVKASSIEPEALSAPLSVDATTSRVASPTLPDGTRRETTSHSPSPLPSPSAHAPTVS